ncbi:MAG: hypothetical protein LN568_05530 [Rickettsia endosymbiont of Pseudomimeciton antennatum]|nr:hypothetical protein [Rickettsia endosymbiont of Pseudomimeciton antennatum]
MIQNIHPSIKKLNISEKAKVYFNKLEFYEIIEDPVVLSTKDNRINEYSENRWSFRVDYNFKLCTKKDLKAFYEAVIAARAKDLTTNHPGVKMIFCAWYDDMSGNLYFSLTQNQWENYNINKVTSIDNIIQDFIDGPDRGVIPMVRLETVDPNDQYEDDDMGNYVLNVWSVILA